VLDLSNCQLLGHEALARMLAHNEELCHLDISSNRFSY
jgi:hypothetical protein